MKLKNNKNVQIIALTALRILIGWHLLYEGLIKVIDPTWSAASYLNAAKGPFASFFKSMALNSNILEIINLLNQWGLVIIGISLMIGLLSRWACIGGILLLFLYYISNPPFIGLVNEMYEGDYLIVSKNLIEISALLVLYFFQTERIYGIERLFIKYKQETI
jgi:thiosulfate dehydrogenase [quinone] large subunit